MSNTHDSFENDLDHLIRLFKKIKDKSKIEHFSRLDPAFAQNLDFIISNYEMMKNNIPKEMFTQMGIPFQQMMREFINQLKIELGDEFEEQPNEEIVEKETGLVKNEPAGDVKEIDAQLQKPGLGEDEINELLDKRNTLLNGS